MNTIRENMGRGNDDLEIIRRYWAGEPSSVLTEEFSTGQVRRVLTESGGRIPRGISPDRYRELKNLVESRVSKKEIHKKYGFHHHVVERYFPLYKGTREPNPEQLEVARKLVKERAPVKVISELTGMSSGTVNKLFPGAAWTREEVAHFGGLHSSFGK